VRITFVLPCYPRKPIGGFRVVYEYANRLVARGHEVAVVHPRRFASATPLLATGFYSGLRRQGARLRDILFPPHVRWHSIDDHVRMLYVSDLDASKVPDGDVVIATAWQTAEDVLGYPSSKGIKCYLIQHYEAWGGPKDRVDATWRAPLHKVVIARWLDELGRGIGCEHMEYIPNGIDHEKYRLLNPISMRPKRVAMLFHGAEWKGCPEGLRALSVVKKQHPDLRTALFGTPRRSESIPEWVEYFQDPPQAEIVNGIYNGSSIYLCASWAEGFPLPPAEAMACGCALVSTDIGGVREYAEPEVTALLSPPRDPEALARNILRLLDDDAFRQRLAVAGHECIQSFTWERSTDQLEAFMRKQVGRG
jgi:glycosyltransferase involved in cell wall biosynthesis